MTLLLSRHLFFFITVIPAVISIPEKGIWEFPISTEPIGIIRSLFNGSSVYVRFSCEPHTSTLKVQTKFAKSCWPPDFDSGMLKNLGLKTLLQTESLSTHSCGDSFYPVEGTFSKFSPGDQLPTTNKSIPAVTVTEDGLYLFGMMLEYHNTINGSIYIEMKGPNGYLSAAEWPLLPFYGTMCLIYFIFGMAWMLVSCIQWRDLLRIQFWIGAVIWIGMIEEALFYEEYKSINLTGESFLGTVLIAELISVVKRSLARILVIIVSLGYGIVKPRLGSHFPKIIAIGITYFILASLEAYLQVTAQPNSNTGRHLWFGGIPLALLDSFICWWIFSSLVQTTRTLRLRRNLVKLTLYNQFTYTLIVAVMLSTIFMIYSIKSRDIDFDACSWNMVWVDQAFWHFLFSLLLLVIMILWRPTNNNQRYAFSPLLDAPDDEDDDEEVEHFVSEGYGVKMRGVGSNRSDSPKSKNVDEDLTWVEENIPSSFIDTNLPILDSDEELINTKFEISKMQ